MRKKLSKGKVRKIAKGGGSEHLQRLLILQEREIERLKRENAVLSALLIAHTKLIMVDKVDSNGEVERALGVLNEANYPSPLLSYPERKTT